MLLCLIILASCPQAKTLDEKNVKSAVETWVRHLPADSIPGAVIETMEPYRVDGETVAYIAHLQGGGFCLCADDDLLLPVYFYRPEGKFDANDSDLQYFLREIAGRKQKYTEEMSKSVTPLAQYEDEFIERANLWNDLIAGNVLEKESDKSGGPPDMIDLHLTSIWGQGSPYNDECPVLTPGTDQHVVTGCGPTAMAQIMYYWQWPNSGENYGEDEYIHRHSDTWIQYPLATDPGLPINWSSMLRWTSDGGGKLEMTGWWDETVFKLALTLSAVPNYPEAVLNLWNSLTEVTDHLYVDFSVADYDWSLMEDDHDGTNPAGDAEVAELCYHIGVAAEANYGYMATGTTGDPMANAFSDHFRYDIDASYQTVDADLIVNEIQWLRPPILMGWDEDGIGHGWVVSGYDNIAGTFYMNLGHYGNNNDWYVIDQVVEDEYDWVLNQKNILYIAPEDVVKFVGISGTGNGTSLNPYGGIDEGITRAPVGATLIFKAGSEYDFGTGTYTFDCADKQLTFKGESVTIRRTP